MQSNLDNLSALLLTELGGSLAATIDLAIADGKQMRGLTRVVKRSRFGDITSVGLWG